MNDDIQNLSKTCNEQDRIIQNIENEKKNLIDQLQNTSFNLKNTSNKLKNVK
jgi:hypothetical protein